MVFDAYVYTKLISSYVALVTHSYVWNRYAAKTFFASLTKIEGQENILSIEYTILFIAVFVDKLQNQESCMHKLPGALTIATFLVFHSG